MKNKIFDAYLKAYIWLLEKIGKAKWTKDIERPALLNRAWVMIDEAAKRGLEVENLKNGKNHTRFYRTKINGKYFYYESLPVGNSYNKTKVEWVTDKWISKKILQKARINTPHGQVIKTLKQALDYIEKQGFPVVIKPTNKSLCVGVTCNIQNFLDLEKAVARVQKYKKFLIEKYILGENYRVTVVDDKVVAVTHRLHPRIMGDGKHTIQQLIDIKNKDPRRGEAKNFSLHPIKVDEFTKQILTEKKLTLSSVLKKDELLVLNQKINLGSGADSVDVTDNIHPKMVEIALKVAKTFDAKLLGLDFLTPDITKAPSKTNEPAIIEVNSYPFIDMHHFPYEGKPRNVAGAIWDMVFKELGVEKVPVQDGSTLGGEK